MNFFFVVKTLVFTVEPTTRKFRDPRPIISQISEPIFYRTAADDDVRRIYISGLFSFFLKTPSSLLQQRKINV